VTRRLGWWTDKNGRRMLRAGDPLTLCPQVQGLKGRPLVRLCTVDVIQVNREPLNAITPSDVIAEGFPEMTVKQFIEFYCVTFQTEPDVELTRIEWRYRTPAPVG
jgi:hypothetical protein